ncbi:MAG: DUF6266 family protein [Fermentimonas sp.]|nr:DUF6266 family protein [Fermentimonas sp.]MDD4010500.1 DUF6266 family protein [Fermentimonas sp.]MDD4698453.1 DUF6266 family protein [Fermentimonas sp.]
MAIGSIFGTLSGKIGNVVVYERNGKQIVRSNPEQRDPKTPAQLAHRMKFSLANKGMSPLNKIIKLGYRNSEKNYRKLVGVAYHTAIVGEYPDFALDYSKIQVAEGDLQLPANIKMSYEEGSNIVSFNWDPQIEVPVRNSRHDDHVDIVCLNSGIMQVENVFNVAKRSDGNVLFQLPTGWELKSSHFWIFLTSYDLGSNSNSLYLAINNQLLPNKSLIL